MRTDIVKCLCIAHHDTLPVLQESATYGRGDWSKNATKEANEAVSAVLKGPSEATVFCNCSYLAFTDEERATIGRYAAHNGNSAAVKKFKEDFESRLCESTVRKFKKQYYEEIPTLIIPVLIPSFKTRLWIPGYVIGSSIHSMQ